MDSAFVTSIQGLSSELFEMIKDYTFQSNSHWRACMTTCWRPPVVSQVNRNTRLASSEFYYATVVFDFSSLDTIAGVDLCACCLCSLDPLAHSQILRIRFASSHVVRTPPLDCTALWQHPHADSNGDTKRIYIEDLDPSSSVLISQHIVEYMNTLKTDITDKHPSSNVRNCCGHARMRAQIILQWFGPDGVVRRMRVLGTYNDAETALIAAAKRECGNGE
nr:hypothetical protein B0A51_05599 [Rachicladosporium sp. CCFEE 5018]